MKYGIEVILVYQTAENLFALFVSKEDIILQHHGGLGPAISFQATVAVPEEFLPQLFNVFDYVRKGILAFSYE